MRLWTFWFIWNFQLDLEDYSCIILEIANRSLKVPEMLAQNFLWHILMILGIFTCFEINL